MIIIMYLCELMTPGKNWYSVAIEMCRLVYPIWWCMYVRYNFWTLCTFENRSTNYDQLKYMIWVLLCSKLLTLSDFAEYFCVEICSSSSPFLPLPIASSRGRSILTRIRKMTVPFSRGWGMVVPFHGRRTVKRRDLRFREKHTNNSWTPLEESSRASDIRKSNKV